MANVQHLVSSAPSRPCYVSHCHLCSDTVLLPMVSLVGDSELTGGAPEKLTEERSQVVLHEKRTRAEEASVYDCTTLVTTA